MSAPILVITRNLPPLTGGMERLTQQLIDALTTEHRVVVIGPPGCAPFLPAGVEVHACRRSGAAGFLIEAAWRTLCLCARRQWLSTVIATSGLNAPLAWLGARLQRRPYLTIVHGLDLVTPAVLYRWVFLPAIRAAATVVANSANTATLARLAGVPATRIVIVHPGVEWPLSLPPAEAFRLRHGLGSRPLLLALGRLVARKGLPEFIACALAAIVDAVPEVMLVIIGDEPHQAIRREQSVMPRLRAAIAERGLSGHVLLRGRADDDEVREACVAAQAFVFPLIPVAGDVEGFGMVAVEAAACGLPTVAFDEGGVADALVPGVTGTLLPSGDYAGMVAALVAELNGADTSARRAACRAAARRFDWPHYRARILAVLARHLRDEEERDMAVDDEQQRELSAIREFYDGAYYRDLPPRLVASGHHERLAARLGVSAGQQVLDVACGTGAWLASCERRGAGIAGVDISERAITFCRSALPRGEFAAGAAEDLPFADQRFDLVTCLGSLEHFVDPIAALHEMRRVAQPAARFVLLVPNADFLTRRLGLFSGTHQTQAKEQVRTLAEWQALFSAAGLTVEARWKDLHVLSRQWIVRRPYVLTPLRALQAVALAWWPLAWQYQVYFLCSGCDTGQT